MAQWTRETRPPHRGWGRVATRESCDTTAKPYAKHDMCDIHECAPRLARSFEAYDLYANLAFTRAVGIDKHDALPLA